MGPQDDHDKKGPVTTRGRMQKGMQPKRQFGKTQDADTAEGRSCKNLEGEKHTSLSLDVLPVRMLLPNLTNLK